MTNDHIICRHRFQTRDCVVCLLEQRDALKAALGGLVDEARERLAEEGLELGKKPASHYSPAMNAALIILGGV